MMTKFKIEGYVRGVWDEDNIISCGNGEDINRFDSEQEALDALEELARECRDPSIPARQYREGLRVVAVDD